MTKATVMNVKVVRIKGSMRSEDYFTRTRAQRDFIANEKQCAADVAEVLSYEEGFAREPSMAVLLAAWARARASFERIAKALPRDTTLRAEMFRELEIRDHAIAELSRKAEALLEGKADARRKEASDG
jgi:hypothetical protein